MRPVSPRAVAYNDELRDASVLVLARSNGVCECCHFGRMEHTHHKLRRSQGGTNDLENLMGVCSACHSWIHAHPADSYAAGYLIRRGQP